MLLLRSLAAPLALVAVTVGLAPQVAPAAVSRPPEGGAIVEVNLQIDGTVFDDSGTRRRACPIEYSFVSTTSPATLGGPGGGGQVTRVVDGVEQVLFWTGCVLNDRELELATTTRVQTVWVGRPDRETVIEEAFADVQELIYPPVVSWPTMDREFGWLYVNTPMEFRVAALTPVQASASLSNILGSVAATVTATPVSVTFFPGEPDGVPVTCSVTDAVAPFAVEVVGACSYRYVSSSAIAANGRTFDTRMSVTWEVTGDLRPGDPRTLETFTDAPLAVAEVQAVVCSDGGC